MTKLKSQFERSLHFAVMEREKEEPKLEKLLADLEATIIRLSNEEDVSKKLLSIGLFTHPFATKFKSTVFRCDSAIKRCSTMIDEDFHF